MTTIHKTIEIPQDRRLNLELQLPESLPAGKAEMKLTISSANDSDRELILTPARQIQAGAKRFQGLAGSLKNSKAFNGDPVEIIRAVRDEW